MKEAYQVDLFGNREPMAKVVKVTVKLHKRRISGNGRKEKDIHGVVRTGSKINQDRLVKQNLKTLNLLLAGGRVNMTNAYEAGIGTPHSRFADVRTWLSEHGAILYDAMTMVTNRAGEKISCKEYWMDQNGIALISEVIKSWK